MKGEEKEMKAKVEATETLWERAYAEGKKVEEKVTGIQASVILLDGEFFLDDGCEYISPVESFCESDFWIVN